MDVTVTFVSLLGLDLAKLNLRFFLRSASLTTDVGGGGKYSGWFVAELVDIMTCCVSWCAVLMMTVLGDATLGVQRPNSMIDNSRKCKVLAQKEIR